MTTPPRPFTTDGCSGHVYRTLFRRDPPWQGCCVDHDRLYWQGGTWRDRLSADRQLRKCVAKRGYPAVGWVMFIFVRVFGTRFLPTTWRWSYGWPFVPDRLAFWRR